MRFMITQRRGPMAVKGMELRLEHHPSAASALNSAGAEAACRSARRLWLRWARPTQRKKGGAARGRSSSTVCVICLGVGPRVISTH